MFRRPEPLEIANIQLVAPKPGVYIVYRTDTGQPFYVGRSRVDIRQRLLRHRNGTGSRRIHDALLRGVKFIFEWEEMISVEQAEAELILKLGTVEFGNLRREVDPADWE
jgi:predicted GIY-YIG superfamily endonuclease